MNSKKINAEISNLEKSIQTLSGEIKNVSCIWKDSKYLELSFKITQLARDSSAIIIAGRECISAITRFQKISEETY